MTFIHEGECVFDGSGTGFDEASFMEGHEGIAYVCEGVDIFFEPSILELSMEFGGDIAADGDESVSALSEESGNTSVFS